MLRIHARKLIRARVALPLCFLVLAAFFSGGCRRRPESRTVAEASALPTLAERISQAEVKVQEDRGEPVGRKAAVDIPAELKHYADHRRFLGIQVAEWHKDGYRIPRDFPDLVEMIKQGQFVEMPALGDAYVLFGVGEKATDEPFTHFDPTTGNQTPLFGSDEDYQKQRKELSDRNASFSSEMAEIKQQLALGKKLARAARNALAGQLRARQAQVDILQTQLTCLEAAYRDPDLRALIESEWNTINQFAQTESPVPYDLGDPGLRKALKVRLLSYVRPEAKKIIEEIAAAYQTAFARSLPITSLVRTEEYQRQLSETNSSAARNSVPPHTTGLAFDMYYYFMAADEQNLLMTQVAQMKSAGRVEALRESRDNIHVFAFADGQPPAETLIAASLGDAAYLELPAIFRMKGAGAAGHRRGGSSRR